MNEIKEISAEEALKLAQESAQAVQNEVEG